LLHRARRAIQNLCRRGGGACPRRRAVGDQARVLRGRSRPRGQPEHAQGADRRRDFALTNTLKSRITFSNGGADQSNFFNYPLLRIDEMPEIVPIVLASDRPPQGFGEVVLAPVAPALAQALLGATGRRLDVMPFPDDAFRANA
jgi:hypothetical protein